MYVAVFKELPKTRWHLLNSSTRQVFDLEKPVVDMRGRDDQNKQTTIKENLLLLQLKK
jgi:hypothetical protein